MTKEHRRDRWLHPIRSPAIWQQLIQHHFDHHQFQRDEYVE